VKTLHALPPIKNEADLIEAAWGEGVVELIRVVPKDDVDAFHSGETHNTVEVGPMPMVLSRAALLRSKKRCGTSLRSAGNPSPSAGAVPRDATDKKERRKNGARRTGSWAFLTRRFEQLARLIVAA
jgi:hypothetical protein